MREQLGGVMLIYYIDSHGRITVTINQIDGPLLKKI
uniref:Uncharacterized protein n=1 Tax=Anguilla anguilla TaxID=7936 RepID=A0A0E9VZF9_ANGAN